MVWPRPGCRRRALSAAIQDGGSRCGGVRRQRRLLQGIFRGLFRCGAVSEVSPRAAGRRPRRASSSCPFAPPRASRFSPPPLLAFGDRPPFRGEGPRRLSGGERVKGRSRTCSQCRRLRFDSRRAAAWCAGRRRRALNARLRFSSREKAPTTKLGNLRFPSAIDSERNSNGRIAKTNRKSTFGREIF